MDLALHPARIDRDGRKVTYRAPLRSLPVGTLVEIDGSAWLVVEDALLLWAPENYVEKRARPASGTVTVLTPRPTVECLRRGYVPFIHDSARVFMT
jgi:hypothetical protein